MPNGSHRAVLATGGSLGLVVRFLKRDAAGLELHYVDGVGGVVCGVPSVLPFEAEVRSAPSRDV